MTTFTEVKFEDMNAVQKVDFLSDLLAEAIVSVEYTQYQRMTESQQQRVKAAFFADLNAQDITITLDVIEQTERDFPNSPMASLLRNYGYTVPFESKYTEAVNQLTEGRKVTIVTLTEFGFPYALNTVINKVELREYAQYKDGMRIIHKPKRKRDLRQNWFYDNKELIVYDGWLDIDADAISKDVIKETADVTITQTKYYCFDNRYLTDILNAIEVKPIVIL